MTDNQKKAATSSADPQKGNNAAPIVTDPLGSYTGRPADPYEVPIQDADDLA